MQKTGKISLIKYFFNTIFIITLVSFSISFWGCTKKKYAEMNARPSAEWVKNAAIYEINLRSFSKDESFKALEAQIPELKRQGFTIISLMPIHPIGELNRTGKLGNLNAVKDFYAVNREFGTLEDFKSLVNTTHQQGLKIIINLVASQAAWDNQLLLEHPDWFVHNEEGAIVSRNYESSDAAQIDYNQHEPRKYMIAIMKFWIQKIGIDGFQCALAELLPVDFWEVARNELDKIKPVIMISESALPEHHIKAFDLTCSWNINDAIANIVNGSIPASALYDSLTMELLKFPKGSLHIRFDLKRGKNKENNPNIEEQDSLSEKMAAILAFTLPGVPLICVDNQDRNNRQLNLFNKFHEDLSMLRRNHPALQYGSYLNAQNSASSHIFSFIRYSGKDSVLIVINFADEKLKTEIQMPAGSSLSWKDHFSGISVKVNGSQLSTAILPLGFLILVPSSEKEIL